MEPRPLPARLRSKPGNVSHSSSGLDPSEGLKTLLFLENPPFPPLIFKVTV